MNDALEMLEYTTILNQIAELTHTEAARCLEVSAPPLTAITGVEAALPLLKLNEILSTD